MADQRATSFGTNAGVYEQGRPDYPRDAVSWLVGDAQQIVDVGAGTGKLTRVLVALPGTTVVAVEPDAHMLDELRAHVPGVRAERGAAEKLPLPDDSADAVVFGQSWHWVDVPTASREVARVLRPGGTLGMLWNIRDNRTDWVQRMTDFMDVAVAEGLFESGGPQVGEPFGALESREWAWSRPMTRAMLHNMASSRSNIIAASDEKRAQVRRDTDALLDELGVHGDETIDLPYVTKAFRVSLPR